MLASCWLSTFVELICYKGLRCKANETVTMFPELGDSPLSGHCSYTWCGQWEGSLFLGEVSHQEP